MSYQHDNTNLEQLRHEAKLFEEGWAKKCAERGESRYIELFDRYTRCYGRVLLPSEVFFVWNKVEWISSSDSDNHRNWEPVVSLVQK